MAVLRGIVGMLGRDVEVPMPPRAQNWLIGARERIQDTYAFVKWLICMLKKITN